MRFDLLDEYSTLVPFGLGVSRKKAFQNPDAVAQETAGPAEVSERVGHPGPLSKLSGAVSTSYRNLVARHSSLS